jgi:hypothetical protein
LLHVNETLDPQDPDVYSQYFKRLYGLDGNPGTSKEMEQAINRADFPEVARLYRLIDRRDVVHVVVPYTREFSIPYRVTSDWLREVKSYTVDAIRTQAEDSVWIGLPVPNTTDWFVLQEMSAYHITYGLCLDAEIPIC